MSLKPLQDNQGSLPKRLRPAWELLRQRSIGAIDEGLEAFTKVAEVSPAEADHIFDSVGVSPRPSANSAAAGLIVGARFTRSDDDANPYLLYALLGLLSRAPIRSRGAELRQAIQWLNLECPAIPELQGFNELMELKLSIRNPSDSSERPTPHVLADRIAPFPCLEKLELHTGDSCRLESLDWLPAPRLKVLHASGVGLVSITGLEEIRTLEVIDISNNKELTDLSPLSSSAACIRSLDLSHTAIDGIGLINGLQKLEKLNIDQCTRITSLESFSHLDITENTMKFSRLGSLASLEQLPMLIGENLVLDCLRLITSLEGLQRAAGSRTVSIKSLRALKDASALEALKRLQEISFGDCGELHSLQCLMHLPELTTVNLGWCKKLDQLPPRWPASLKHLSIGICAITEIGILPPSYNSKLDLSQCFELKTLKGIELCSELSEVIVGPRSIDVSALSKLPNTWLCIDFQHSNEDEWLLSDELVDALVGLPQLRLKILNFRRPTHWKLDSSDLAPLARITHLRALDISDLKVTTASFLMGLGELELLKVKPRSELSLALGGCTFDSANELAKLKLTLLGMG